MQRRTMMLAALATASTVAHAQGQGKKALLVVQQGGPNMAVDEAVRQRLQSRGWLVTLAHQNADPAQGTGFGLVLISSTVSGKDVRPGWRQLGVPLLTWENDLLDDLAMTGKRLGTDYGDAEKERYLWVVNAPHPMAGGVPAGVANVYARQASMGWGKPGLGASTIATLYGQPDKAAIFGYEKGATMDYETLAPARRVMFFLDNGTFTNLSPLGLQLFDAAVDWAAGQS